jgi:hypothetical protein
VGQPVDPGSVGRADIEVHAEASEPQLEREMRPAVQGAADAVERDMDKAGDEWGKTSAKSMGDRLEKEGPTIAERFQKVFSRFKITKKIDVDVDRDHLVSATKVALEDAFEEASKPNGVLGKFGQGIADAIGAGFNVSGKSPLIAVLVPLIGAIIGLVIAAIQAVSALVTLLASLPVLLGAIGAQVGVFVIAFQGVGAAIQGAFAAKNAKELNEALKGLAPSAQAFVRELLPLRKLFTDIQKSVQQNFFAQLKGDITAIAKALGPQIGAGLSELATTLGGLLHELAGFLASPLFKEFVATIFSSTQTFLEIFGPNIGRLFRGLIELAIAATPLLESFGKQFSMFLGNAGRFFDEVANDPAFQKFLEDMGGTFFQLFRLINSTSALLASFAGMLNQVGGNNVIAALAEAFDQLAFFFQTPLGEEGLKGFIDLAIQAIKSAIGLIELFFILIAAVRNVGPAIGALFDFIGGKILDFVHMVGQWFTDLGHSIVKPFNEFKVWLESLIPRITTALSGAGTALLAAGRNLIQGLINGIREKLGPLDDIMSFIAGKIRNFFPFSPAKEGPLSGPGDPRIAGGKIVQRLGEGMHMEIPSLRANTENVVNNITFGAGAIQQSFQGLPTVTQAQGIGAGVGTGISDGLANRDARLRVRTM